jgi:ubiquinone biosynthesis protein UbiJ
VEWCGAQAAGSVDLQITIDAVNPAKALAQALAGERPRVDVSGDAAFATDMNWLFDNLRWDIEDDLAKLVGPALAHELARVGRLMAGGLREVAGTVGSMGARGSRSGQTL